MKKINLVWALIWSLVLVTCIIGIFWNPAHYVTAAISAFFAVMFWHDWRTTKDV